MAIPQSVSRPPGPVRRAIRTAAWWIWAIVMLELLPLAVLVASVWLLWKMT